MIDAFEMSIFMSNDTIKIALKQKPDGRSRLMELAYPSLTNTDSTSVHTISLEVPFSVCG